jgi:hypothetical protein
MHATVDELREVVFSVESAQRLSGGPKPMKSHARVEAVSNTTTISLQVVGGDETGTQCLEV